LRDFFKQCQFSAEEQKEKGLKCPVTDEFLIRFLRARKGDPYWGLEAVRFNWIHFKNHTFIRATVVIVFLQIQSYYKMRLTVPSIKEKLNPESARKFLTSGMFTLLKGRESRGCPVVYFKSGTGTSVIVIALKLTNIIQIL